MIDTPHDTSKNFLKTNISDMTCIQEMNTGYDNCFLKVCFYCSIFMPEPEGSRNQGEFILVVVIVFLNAIS